MKQKIKFLSVVTTILLVSSLVLTYFMYVIASDQGETKPYDLNLQNINYENIIENDAPLAQSELQKKFNTYLHKDGKSVTVFSEEQYVQLKDIRVKDERTALTYDEIMYLVNDSINLYFMYDEVRLYNACADRMIPTSLGCVQSSNDCVIYPYHGNYAEYEDYNDAQSVYGKVLEEIYSIIFYRIYMHDAGFETVHHTYHFGDEYIFGERYNAEDGMINSAVPIGHFQMLSIDDATFSGIKNEEKLVGEYKILLEWEDMSMNAVIDYETCPPLNAPILATRIINTLRAPMEYKFYIVGPKEDNNLQIYPTSELEAMKPHRESLYVSVDTNSGKQPGFSLNYETALVVMGADTTMSFAMTGTFQYSDEVLKMYFDQGDDEYSYVFHKSQNGYVYIAKDSKPMNRGGFDFADGLVFRLFSDGVEAPIASCLSYLGGKYALTLPKSKKIILLKENKKAFVPYISDILVRIAELRIEEEVCTYKRHSEYYLFIDTDGYLYLTVEVIKDIVPTDSAKLENGTIGGCGYDHEHIFVREKISTKSFIQ